MFWLRQHGWVVVGFDELGGVFQPVQRYGCKAAEVQCVVWVGGSSAALVVTCIQCCFAGAVLDAWGWWGAWKGPGRGV